MNLVTGYRGSAHVTSNDVAALNRAVFGDGACVINTGNMFAAELQSDLTTLRIWDGEAIIQGRHARIASGGDYEDVELTAGTSGDNRMDYIAIQLTKDATGIEAAAIVQVCGTATTDDTAELPALTQEDLNNVGTTYQFPLYTVEWTGTTMGTPVQVFTAVKNIFAQLEAKQDALTGAASTIATSDLTAGFALISNTSGKVGLSKVTATELAYLSGVTSNVQTQINSISDCLKGIGRHYFAASSANLASNWVWTLKKFDTYTEIDDKLGNLTSTVTSGYWIPPKAGFFVANFVVTFASSAKGSRGVRMNVYDSDGNLESTMAMQVVPGVAHSQPITVTAAGALESTWKIGLAVCQDSGSTLAVSATARILFIPNY